MEWEIDSHDLKDQVLRLSSSKNFQFLKRFVSDNNNNVDVKRWTAAVAFETDVALQRLITQLGFSSEEEIHAKSREQAASLLTRIERLHGARSKSSKKERDFVSGLDLGKLQEKLVELFLLTIDQDLDYILNAYREVAMFESWLKHVLMTDKSVAWIKWQLELTGSSAEAAQVPDVNYEHGDECITVNPEYDIMMNISCDSLGLSEHEQSITDANYPGFVYLHPSSVSHPGNSENLLKFITVRNSKCYLSALKFRTEIYRIFNDNTTLVNNTEDESGSEADFKLQATVHGPAVQIDDMFSDSENPYLSYDLVPAITFSGWPKCSAGWNERERAWPPPEMVEEIVQSGFGVVAKTSPLGDEELEWRLSFSKAEIKLMNAKDIGNRNYCYRMFKTAIKGNVMSTCKLLSSYHLKTLLLWASERHPPDYWSDDNIGVCFLGLLDDLLHSLINRSCPHYFIANLNLFANCSTDHLHHLASQVSAMRQCPMKYIKRPQSDPNGYENFMAAMREWREMDYGEI